MAKRHTLLLLFVIGQIPCVPLAQEAPRTCSLASGAKASRQADGSTLALAPVSPGLPTKGCRWFPNGDYFEGQLKGNLPNGPGRYEWYKDGVLISKYDGDWKDGVMNGSGRLDQQTTWFKGAFQDGQFLRGDVFISYSSKSYYKGQFAAKKRNGEGVFVDEEGGVYEGTYVDNELVNGKATFRLPDGRKYTGTFVNGKASGYAKISADNGSYLYEGGTREGRPHGTGELVYSTGPQPGSTNKYSGMFTDGKFHGQGQLSIEKRPIGQEVRLEGPFKWQKANTASISPDAGVIISYSGSFSNGDLAIGKIFMVNCTYEGDLVNLVPHGDGTIVFFDGSRKSYKFLHGLPDNW